MTDNTSTAHALANSIAEVGWGFNDQAERVVRQVVADRCVLGKRPLLRHRQYDRRRPALFPAVRRHVIFGRPLGPRKRQRVYHATRSGLDPWHYHMFPNGIGDLVVWHVLAGRVWYTWSASLTTGWLQCHFGYTTMPVAKGIREQNRRLLDKLHRAATGPFSADEAADMLSVSRGRAQRLLAYLASRGWLARIRRGTYTTVPLGAASPSEWREDPWIVAHDAFAPCYISGWSACEHWELTEQIFREIVVITAASIREREQTIQGTPFRLKFLREEMHFGTRPVWRKQCRVLVSDPHRTIVDILDDPEIGGGIRHCADVVRVYFESEHRDDTRLIQYVESRNNRTVFKRLGYVVEALGINAPEVLDTCRAGQSAGLSPLDPANSLRGRIVKRWNLRVNALVGETRVDSS